VKEGELEAWGGHYGYRLQGTVQERYSHTYVAICRVPLSLQLHAEQSLQGRGQQLRGHLGLGLLCIPTVRGEMQPNRDDFVPIINESPQTLSQPFFACSVKM
jgi:hypothetical protein